MDFSTLRSGAHKTRLKIGTPLTPATPSTPDTARISDIESLDASSEAGSSVSLMTPDLARLNLGRGRGRPRKEMTKPTMEDFPLDGSEEEQKKYIARKRSEMWRYKKLTGSDSAEYRQKELKRVKNYQQERKTEEGDLSTDSQGEHKKELSWQR